jgi:hypothetical protein
VITPYVRGVSNVKLADRSSAIGVIRYSKSSLGVASYRPEAIPVPGTRVSGHSSGHHVPHDFDLIVYVYSICALYSLLLGRLAASIPVQNYDEDRFATTVLTGT